MKGWRWGGDREGCVGGKEGGRLDINHDWEIIFTRRRLKTKKEPLRETR